MPSYGCVFDKPDDRDLKFKLAPPSALVLTDSHDLTRAFPPPLDQGPYGSCTAHAVTEAYRYNLINTGREDVPLSRAQLYWDSGVLEGDTGDVGRQIRDVVKCIATKGVASESIWPYDKIGQEPHLGVYAAAFEHMILEYQRVDVNRHAINEAIYIGHPVIVGVNVYQEFESEEVMATGIVPMPRSFATPIAAHAVLVGAYDPQWDTFLNSWGSWFGLPEKKGYGKFPRGYLEREGNDFWTVFIDK